MLLTPRNAISANPEHYIFKISWGSMPSNPLEGLIFFSPPRGSKIFFRIDSPPQTKSLDRTLTGFHTFDIRATALDNQFVHLLDRTRPAKIWGELSRDDGF